MKIKNQPKQLSTDSEDRSHQLHLALYNNRLHHMHDIEKQNLSFLKKLENVKSDYKYN